MKFITTTPDNVGKHAGIALKFIEAFEAAHTELEKSAKQYYPNATPNYEEVASNRGEAMYWLEKFNDLQRNAVAHTCRMQVFDFTDAGNYLQQGIPLMARALEYGHAIDLPELLNLLDAALDDVKGATMNCLQLNDEERAKDDEERRKDDAFEQRGVPLRDVG